MYQALKTVFIGWLDFWSLPKFPHVMWFPVICATALMSCNLKFLAKSTLWDFFCYMMAIKPWKFPIRLFQTYQHSVETLKDTKTVLKDLPTPATCFCMKHQGVGVNKLFQHQLSLSLQNVRQTSISYKLPFWRKENFKPLTSGFFFYGNSFCIIQGSQFQLHILCPPGSGLKWALHICLDYRWPILWMPLWNKISQ